MKKRVKAIAYFLFLCGISLTTSNCSQEKDVPKIVTNNYTINKYNKNSTVKNQKTENNLIDILDINYPNEASMLKNVSSSVASDSNVKTYSIIEYYDIENELIAYEVFYSKKEFKHSLYLREKNTTLFKEEFDLKDNMVNFNNLEFIAAFYLDHYNKISIKMHINNSFEKSVMNQVSEFEAFKTSKLFKLENGSKHKKSNIDYFQFADDVGSGTCNAICFGGFGSCNTFTRDCGGAPGGCGETAISRDAKFVNNFPDALSLFKFADHYKLRDEFLNTTITGKKLINYYYSISALVDTKDFTINDYAKLVSMLPEINIAVKKIVNNESGIIISKSFKKDIFEFIDILQSKSTSKSYQSILYDLKLEINNLSGKDKSQMVQQMVVYE